VDGVALGQPAVSLAAKLTQRATRAGLPADLLPGDETVGAALFAIAASAVVAGLDPEGELRAAGRRFAADLRAAETAAADAGVDPLSMDADRWRKFWPR
jgi:XTP/dITP diphosphohydrolase